MTHGRPGILIFPLLLLVAHPIIASCTNPTMQELTPMEPGHTGDFSLAHFQAADIDRDGRLDIVTSSSVNDDVRVHLGNGDGTFDPYVSYPVTDAERLLLRDLNHDDWLDIVLTHQNSKIGVLLNDGDGTFAPVVSIEASLHLVNAIEAADFNNDSNLDLLITDLGLNGYVNVWFGNGSGGFPTHTEWFVSGVPDQSSPGDFNGDGRQDIATVAGAFNGNPGTLSIFLNTINGFPTTPNHTYTLNSTLSMYDIAVADFNADGRLDLTVASYDAFKLYLGNADGSFSSGMAGSITPSDFAAVAANDFNEDGVNDVVFGSRNGSDVVFLTGLNNGNFAMPPFRFASSYSHMSEVVAADFDSDGRPDVMLLEYDQNEIRMLRNVCSSRLALVSMEASGNVTYPQDVTITVRVRPRGGTLLPSGTVTLTDNGVFVATKTLDAGSLTPTAVFTVTKPSVGTHNFVATYNGDSNFASATASLEHTIVRPPFGPPLDLIASGNPSTNQITLQWVGRTGAVSYDVYRKNAGVWQVIANTTLETYTDSAIENTKPYVYAIRSISASETSDYSNAAIANTYTYSAPLASGAPVKAIEFTELRTLIGHLRTAVGLSAFPFTDPSLTAGVTIKRVHLTELRTALEQALAAVGLPAPSYNQPTITAGSTVIKRLDVQELRTALD